MKQLALIGLMAVIHSLGQLCAQPPTPAQRQFNGWLEVVNRGEPAAILKYLEQNYPTAQNHGQNTLQIAEMTGGFEVVRLLDFSTTSVTALVKMRKADQYATLTLTTQSGEPYHITGVRVGPGKRPQELAPARMSEGLAVAAIRDEMERQAAKGEFSGALMITRNGKPIVATAVGLADRDKRVANHVETRFRIGSMNKMFTAVGTLQLIEAGKLALAGTVGQYLPDHPNREIASKVTVQQLLTHTGGTGDIFGPEFDAHRMELTHLTDYLALYGQRGPKFEPGQRFEYSNYGFLLLGAIVQKVSGTDYYAYIREHVYKPAGMTRSDSLPESDRVSELSTGYTHEGGSHEWRSNANTLPFRGIPAGGGYSTVGDLCRFAEALRTNKLLNSDYTRMMTTGKADAGGDKYAFGFFEGRTGDEARWFGHGGGAPGMNGELRIFPDSGYVVAVLSNLDPPTASAVAQFAIDRLPLL